MDCFLQKKNVSVQTNRGALRTHSRLGKAKEIWQSDYKGWPGVFFVSKGHQLDSMANLAQSQQITYCININTLIWILALCPVEPNSFVSRKHTEVVRREKGEAMPSTNSNLANETRPSHVSLCWAWDLDDTHATIWGFCLLHVLFTFPWDVLGNLKLGQN